MVPTFVMPAWIQSISFISPIRWTMLAIEGGVWRDYSISEMALPCAILITIGIACFALGTRSLREA
jgi:ABC-2 type transport system permease protein